MHARVTRIEATDGFEEMARQFEERTVPLIEGLDGYKGYVLLGDSADGLAMAVTYWESEAAMQASSDAVKPERDRAAKTAGASSEPAVELYEVLSSS